MDQVTLTRDELVLLLRMAADTSGEPLSINEQGFLRQVAHQQGITREDGVPV